MNFSVIYSADVPEGIDLSLYAPKAGEWQRTEQGKTEYAYLEGRWDNGTHGKWCAMLTRAEFDDLVNRQALYAESTETMGSLGAPGFGMGWSPAISFTSDDDNAILSMYVTPVPSRTSGEHSDTEANWERVRNAILNLYGA